MDDQPDDGRAAPTRRDLAAMLAPLAQGFAAAELPILRAHDLTMWAYVVLITLADNPIRSQARLAAATGADKTRIIPILDDLQARGLIDRYPDPADRRVHLLALTDEGLRLCRAAQAQIQRHEEQVLARIDPADRAGLLRALEALTALPPEEITGEHESPTTS
ncbi:winged helix DNA-binding protein [Nocardia sp. NEAU-G5]|uniref:Winged helix DNA-binding protein n=1 Tax=Nocardia albiluteola TaxID=2842303 RepID=A0ABS6B7G4_9NOCA|nr:MarR family transcriptional regulator [Nocardia albiluteola]MBU3066261.1 winged helix DNA-binding protein [Nocardia albiluteola]